MILAINENHWKYTYYPSLNVKDLLNLLKTCRLLYKQKFYIYKLIFTKLINYTSFSSIDEITIHTDNIIIIKSIFIIIKNNEYLRKMFYKHKSNKYNRIFLYYKMRLKQFINNEFSFEDTVNNYINDYKSLV